MAAGSRYFMANHLSVTSAKIFFMSAGTAATDALRGVVERTRDRAQASRRAYNLTLAAMICVAVSLVSLYLFASSVNRSSSSGGTGIVTNVDFLMLVTVSVIARLGSVVVGIFAVQMLFAFARYHARLSQHLEAVADALELSGGDTERIRLLVTALAPKHVDFGKTPQSPAERAFELATEVAKAAKGQ